MSDIPWIVKASANWNERQHPRDHGQFASKPGAGGATDRHNPDLDAAFADAPAKPKPPAGDMRRNTALDEFMGLGNDGPAPARPPARPPTGKAPQGKIPKGKKAAVRALAAKATGQLKLAAAAEQAGDHKAAQSHRAAAHGYNRAARHQEKGDRRAAVAVAAIADEFAAGGRQLNAVPGAGPNTAAGAVAPTPQPPPARASQPAPQAGPAAAPRPAPTRPAAVPWAAHPAAKPAPAKPQPPAARPAAQPPALPHHRSEQAAQQAAKAVVQAARGGGDVKQAHGAAMQSLDAHLKAGLAELDRRGGNPRHKQAFAKKIAAARAKLNGLAGVDHPRTEPRASVQRPAVRRGFSRHKGVSVPWLVKSRDASGHEHAADGKFGEGGGGKPKPTKAEYLESRVPSLARGFVERARRAKSVEDIAAISDKHVEQLKRAFAEEWRSLQVRVREKYGAAVADDPDMGRVRDALRGGLKAAMEAHEEIRTSMERAVSRGAVSRDSHFVENAEAEADDLRKLQADAVDAAMNRLALIVGRRKAFGGLDLALDGPPPWLVKAGAGLTGGGE